MVKCIWKRETLGLENITLGVWEKNERDSSRRRCLLVVGTCITKLDKEGNLKVYDQSLFLWDTRYD